MLTVLDCAHWQQRVYDPLNSQNGWTNWNAVEDGEHPWVWGIVDRPEFRLLVLRGSTTQLDWFQDMRSQRGIVDGRLGVVPEGFDFGLDKSGPDLALSAYNAKSKGKKFIIVGHSLGAARACLLAGVCRYNEWPVHGLVLFGCPRPGQQRLKDLLLDIPFIRSYRNRADPVCEVPLDIPFFDPWIHPTNLTPLDAPPLEGDEGVLADHHIDLYARAMPHEVVV